MRLKNTSRYAADEVRRLVEFGAHGVNLSGVAVHVKNCSRAYAGRAYRGVPCISRAAQTKANYLVALRIGSGPSFPADNTVTRIRWSGRWMSREELNAEHQRPRTEDVRARMRREGGAQEWQLGVVVRHPYGGKRSPYMEVRDWREALVVVAAHEARHIHQFRHGKRVSEVDCERFAAKALDRYRATQGSS